MSYEHPYALPHITPIEVHILKHLLYSQDIITNKLLLLLDPNISEQTVFNLSFNCSLCDQAI